MTTGIILLPDGTWYTLGGSSGYLLGSGGSFVLDSSITYLDMVGIASTTTFGFPTIESVYNLDMVGIPSTTSVGFLSFGDLNEITMIGIASTTTFGAFSIEDPTLPLDGNGSVTGNDATVRGFVLLDLGVSPRRYSFNFY
jgi:hypothetical protein